MNKMLLIIGLALAVSPITAVAQQGQGNGEQRRDRQQIRERGDQKGGNGEVRRDRQRRGAEDGSGRRQGPRDGSGPRGAQGNCERHQQGR